MRADGPQRGAPSPRSWNVRTANSRRCSPKPCSRTGSWKRSPKKNGRPGASASGGPRSGDAWTVFRAGGLSHPTTFPRHLLVSSTAADASPRAFSQAAARLERSASALRLPAHRRAFTPGGLGRGQASHPATTPCRRAARAADQAQARAPGRLHWVADEGHPAWARVDVGLRERCHRARRRAQDADHPR